MAPVRISKCSFSLPVGNGEAVPSVFQIPEGAAAVPGVLLLHGFTSRKERVAESIGRSLAVRGVASLAIDLPMHGARQGRSESLSLRNPLALVQTWKLAVREANQAIEYLAAQEAIDPGRLAIAGYSIGAYLAMVVAADNPRVRAIALVAGGDLPEQTPFLSFVRGVADPRRAARSLAGRPLLMVNGKRDRTVTPAQARALFAAASEPKELRWYDGGHWPPETAIDDVALWLADQLSNRTKRRLA
jgi:dienelactone hydrolase